jgi:hypothetical protein
VFVVKGGGRGGVLTVVCRGCWTFCIQSSVRRLTNHISTKSKNRREREREKKGKGPTKRINQIHPPLPLKRHNLPTRTPHIRIDIKSLPQMIYTTRSRHRTHIQQHTHVRLEDGSESVEEPSMGVYFLLVLFFEAEY